jgi:sugar lactone lactonase YvrE
LVSDSRLGGIYSINVRTGEVALVIQDVLLEGIGDGAFGFGINGLRTQGHKLFFANTAKKFFGSLQLTSSVQTVGPIQTISTVPNGTDFTAYDDFALDKEGNAWIALHSHALVVVTPSGEQYFVLGGDGGTFLADPTSAAFGRGEQGGKETLFVVTAGFGISGGQVVAIDY